MDLATGTARQLTSGRDVDSRPAWHPSGDRLALVRDNDHDTRIVVVDAASGTDVRTVDTPAIDLDPAFSPDGGTLYYTSGQAGTLDVWALDLVSGESRALDIYAHALAEMLAGARYPRNFSPNTLDIIRELPLPSPPLPGALERRDQRARDRDEAATPFRRQLCRARQAGRGPR